MCGFFKGKCLGLLQVLSLTQTLLVFAAKSYGLIFLTLEPWSGDPGVGLGLLTPKISLLNVYSPQVGVRPACSMSSPLLPVWMDVVAIIP